MDGWVSLEVSPLLAHDTVSTIAAAKELSERAGRPNLFIKIPGTKEGAPAIEEAIFAGVPVNVTLLFSREHYVAAAEAYLRRVHAPFGALTDGQWRQLTETSVRALPDGGLALHFDPALTEPILAGTPQDMDLWPLWARIQIPMLVLRGAESDLLLPETLQQMAEKAVTHVVPHCGHAPALMDAPTIAVVRGFLEG